MTAGDRSQDTSLLPPSSYLNPTPVAGPSSHPIYPSSAPHPFPDTHVAASLAPPSFSTSYPLSLNPSSYMTLPDAKVTAPSSDTGMWTSHRPPPLKPSPGSIATPPMYTRTGLSGPVASADEGPDDTRAWPSFNRSFTAPSSTSLQPELASGPSVMPLRPSPSSSLIPSQPVMGSDPTSTLYGQQIMPNIADPSSMIPQAVAAAYLQSANPSATSIRAHWPATAPTPQSRPSSSGMRIPSPSADSLAGSGTSHQRHP